MPHCYYIYYRVAANQVSTCEARVRTLFEQIREGTEVQGVLMRKRGEPLLWMEVYDDVADETAFEHALNRAVENSGIEACLQPGASRRMECFEPAAGGAGDARAPSPQRP